MGVSTTSIHLPGLLREQVIAAREVGFYTSEEELVADAVRTLLAARPDMRLTTACRLYERGAISLGKTAELAGLDVENIKRALAKRGITRTAPESPTDTTRMARESLRAAGRSL